MGKRPPNRPGSNEERQRVVVDLPAKLVDRVDTRRFGKFSRAEWIQRALEWALDQPETTAPIERRQL